MMMRRVQTAAGESGGGEGASDVLDESDASDVILVSCNASAILAKELRCWSDLCCRYTKPSLLLTSRVNLGCVYATFNGLLAGLLEINIFNKHVNNAREHCYLEMYRQTDFGTFPTV